MGIKFHKITKARGQVKKHYLSEIEDAIKDSLKPIVRPIPFVVPLLYGRTSTSFLFTTNSISPADIPDRIEMPEYPRKSDEKPLVMPPDEAVQILYNMVASVKVTTDRKLFLLNHHIGDDGIRKKGKKLLNAKPINILEAMNAGVLPNLEMDNKEKGRGVIFRIQTYAKEIIENRVQKIKPYKIDTL